MIGRAAWHPAAHLLRLRRPAAPTFAAFAFPGMDGGVVMHDRYQNYVRHGARCYIARGAGREWRRCPWV